MSNGMKVKVIDHLSPEDVAMLQALYSRSGASVDEHLLKVEASGSGKFMDNYVVGYTHKSIADCGSSTVFSENVSILAAKAVQNWPLYCGQESSTRYIDMADRVVVDPLRESDPGARIIHQMLMQKYNESLDPVAEYVRAEHPRRPEESEASYNRAVKARTFDILRSLLPAGITTQLSWHSNLRQFGDHLVDLGHHPLPEVQALSTAMRHELHEKYSSSGFDRNIATVSGVNSKDEALMRQREEWERYVSKEFSYWDGSPHLWAESSIDGVSMETNIVGPRHLKTYYDKLFSTRPRGCVLPHFLSKYGTISFWFTLDYGSFRDIQRHRNGVCEMPVLDTSYGFEPWYLKQLCASLGGEIVDFLDEIKSRIATLNTTHKTLRQYYTPLGYRVPVVLTYALPAAVYVMELRSGKTIHPTLRQKILKMVEKFEEVFPIPLHIDRDPDDWTVRRGDQTITKKE